MPSCTFSSAIQEGMLSSKPKRWYLQLIEYKFIQKDKVYRHIMSLTMWFPLAGLESLLVHYVIRRMGYKGRHTFDIYSTQRWGSMSTQFVDSQIARYKGDLNIFSKKISTHLGRKRNIIQCCRGTRYSFSLLPLEAQVDIPSSLLTHPACRGDLLGG